MNPIAEPAAALLRRMFDAAVAAAAPDRAVPRHLPAPPARGRTVVVGAGKAAAATAKAVEDHWLGPLTGLVVTRYGHGVPTRAIEVVEAAHPVPDAAGRQAAGRLLDMVQGLGPEDLALCLISGGGSALLALPAPGLTLEDKQAVTGALLSSGASIHEINCVRKHLSAIKGGRLAAAAFPARLIALIISDVPGDDPAVIASGPTVADPTTFAEARAVLARYAIDGPAAVVAHLQAAAAETPKPGDPRLDRASAVIVARPMQSLHAAATVARASGFSPIVLGDDLQGEARRLGAEHAQLALDQLGSGRSVALISGGETTVAVTGTGRGGRNAEYLLGLALALNGADRVHAIACDTDGIDGSGDNAGAIIGPDSLARAQALGLDGKRLLADNDAYRFFATLGDLVVTGPTRTNVNDFRAVLVINT